MLKLEHKFDDTLLCELGNEMTPMFESVEDGSNCMDRIVKNNNLPGGALHIGRSWRVKEWELFLEGGLARLCLTEQ